MRKVDKTLGSLQTLLTILRRGLIINHKEFDMVQNNVTNEVMLIVIILGKFFSNILDNVIRQNVYLLVGEQKVSLTESLFDGESMDE
jgi:hypothetical protein